MIFRVNPGHPKLVANHNLGKSSRSLFVGAPSFSSRRVFVRSHVFSGFSSQKKALLAGEIDNNRDWGIGIVHWPKSSYFFARLRAPCKAASYVSINFFTEIGQIASPMTSSTRSSTVATVLCTVCLFYFGKIQTTFDFNYARSTFLEMMSLWISLVPSPIVQSFASR